MQFVKTLIWVVVAIIIALFAIRNGSPVTVNLWADLQMVTPLWVVVVLAFLAGALPVLLMHRAARWHWRRRHDAQERTIADLRIGTMPPPSEEAATVTTGETATPPPPVLPPAAGL